MFLTLLHNTHRALIKYISNFLSYHHNVDELDGINDTKNGLFLWPPIHITLGSGSLGVLEGQPKITLFCSV